MRSMSLLFAITLSLCVATAGCGIVHADRQMRAQGPVNWVMVNCDEEVDVDGLLRSVGTGNITYFGPANRCGILIPTSYVRLTLGSNGHLESIEIDK